MTRRPVLRRLTTAAILAGTTALLSAGCADNESSMFVGGVLKLKSPECVANADQSADVLLGGTLDLAFRNHYTAALLIGNQLTRRGSRTQVRTETSRIALRGAEVELRSPSGDTIQEFTVDGSGFVDPGRGEDAGYGVMFVPLIPDGSALPSQVTAVVRVFGDTLGGAELTSSALTFPISICSGCLIDYPAEAVDPVTRQCAGMTTGGDEPCIRGQDELIDCRSCVDYAICRTIPGVTP